jgi:hypothetical protein
MGKRLREKHTRQMIRRAIEIGEMSLEHKPDLITGGERLSTANREKTE